MQIFSRFLIANKKMGSIVNISSIVGKIGFSKLSAYASTKGALTALTKSFATEMADKNIRANSISPGFIKTGDEGKIHCLLHILGTQHGKACRTRSHYV